MKTNEALYEQYRSIAFERAAGGVPSAKDLELEFGPNLGRFIPEDRNAAILDVGCGMGHFLAYLEARGYTRCSGTDASLEQVEFCRTHLKSQVHHSGDIIEFLKRNSGWDCVILKDVIEHLPRHLVIPILSSICDALNPGGSLLVETGNLTSVTGVYLRYIDFTHECGFTENSLRQVLKAAGFSTIELRPNQDRFYSWKSRVLTVARWFWERALKMIYRIERGWDAVPTIYSKLLLARAVKSHN